MTHRHRSPVAGRTGAPPPRIGMDLKPPTWEPTRITADPAFQSRQVRSKIVLSFAMKGGGDPFVRWLHNKLMERLALSKKSIYADHILAPFLALEEVPMAVRENVGPFQREVEAALRPGLPSGIYGSTVARLDPKMPTMTVKRDLRPEMMRPDGSFPDGYQRDDWEVLFQSAIRSSQVAVLVLNDQYMKSDFCQSEVRMVRDENDRRAKEGRPALRVVALRVRRGRDNEDLRAAAIDQMIRASMDQPTIVAVTPVLPAAGTPDHRQMHWTISEHDLSRVVQAIGHLTAKP